MAKRAETKIVYSPQYKCRRCGVFFPGIGKLPQYPEYGYGRSILWNLDEWYWTLAEREARIKHLSQVTGAKCELIDIPYQFYVHDCLDGSVGISDFVGLINQREVVKRGNEWVLVENSK